MPLTALITEVREEDGRAYLRRRVAREKAPGGGGVQRKPGKAVHLCAEGTSQIAIRLLRVLRAPGWPWCPFGCGGGGVPVRLH